VRGQLNAFGVAFSPDGQRLTSASVGREAINLWDSQTRQELLTLASAATLHMTVRWTADGNAILVGSPIEVWHAPSWDEIAEVEAKEHASPNARASVR
jgi:WD40 repeat protein